jgi:hypothetical protein
MFLKTNQFKIFYILIDRHRLNALLTKTKIKIKMTEIYVDLKDYPQTQQRSKSLVLMC